MKKVKRILSLITAIAVMLGTLVLTPVSASAAVDSGYGLLWGNDFEVDTTGFEYPQKSTHDFGNGLICNTDGSSDARHRIIDMGDEYHKSGFGAVSTFNNSWAKGTKTFSEDMKSDLMVFSTQMKTSAYLAGYNALEMYLYRDGNVLAGPTPTNANHQKFLNLFMDNAETTMVGSASVLHSTYGGGHAAPKVNGIDDTDWHQIDIVADKAEQDLILYIDGTLAYTNVLSYATSCDADGNFTFDQFAVRAGTNTANGIYTYLDNIMITDAAASDVFGVSDVIVGTDVVYAELSATVASGQTVPQVTLRKVGTNTAITPASVAFEGSQAIKIEVSGLEANAEYEIVYPDSVALTDIVGRGFDTAKEVTFYTDGEGNGVAKARLVSANGSLVIPDGNAMRGAKGMELTFEEALTAPAVTFTAEDEAVTVNMTNDGSKYTLSWTSLNADYYELIVKDGDTVVYEYSLTDVLSIDPIYPENDGYGLLWGNDFEVDTTGFEYPQKSTHDFGNGLICNTDGSSDARHRIIDMGDEYHKSGFGAVSTWDDSHPIWAKGTKTFSEDRKSDLMVFSTQMKTSAYLAGYNALEMYLYRDGNVLAGPNPGNLNHTKFLNLFMDNADTTMVGSASVLHSTYGGGYAAPKVNGLDDTDWHQIDIVADKAEQNLILYIDGTLAYTNTASYAAACDADGNFTFDQFAVRTGSNHANQIYTYVDNVMITDAAASDVFGVSDVIVGTDAVYAELSATVASGQTVPQVTLRKVGTSTEITPTSVAFEGSQAIKIEVSGLEANAEYEIVYPENFTLTDITGRSIDKEQMVTFYIDGAGNGVKFARLVNLDNTISIPTEAPSNAIKGIVIETEEAATNVTATLESANDTAAVSVTGAGNEWTVAWGEFLDAEEYTLTVTADGNVVYTYVFTPEVSGELSISEFAVYDAQGNEIRDWSDALRGQTLTATAHIINPTGVDKFACVSYAAYANKWLRAVSYNDNDGEAIAETFNGTPIEISFNVPSDATMVKVMLWSGMDTMKPLAPAISID